MGKKKVTVKKTRTEKIEEPWQPEDLLSTGSTLLNLIISGDKRGGFVKGRYFYWVGDSDSGKSFFTLTTLAEASINPSFDDYRLIYDDVEGGALMDVEEFFGPKLASRIEPPAGTKEKPIHSNLIEEFYYNLDDAFKRNVPFIYVLDSQDALDSNFAEKKFQEGKTASRTDTKAKGDFGDGKAKFHSTRIRSVTAKLRDTGSILIVVNQTRDNLDSGPFAPKSSASGGRALRFYASCQIWTQPKGKLEKSVRSKKRQVGINVKMTVKKNRLKGRQWTVDVPIYWSHGVDDVGSCVSYLCDEKEWIRSDKGIITPSEDFEEINPGHLDKVIEQIEAEGLEDEVREIAEEVIEEIIAKSKVNRKKRYV